MIYWLDEFPSADNFFSGSESLHPGKSHDLRVSINGGSQNGWFKFSNPIKMDDFGVVYILENLHI